MNLTKRLSLVALAALASSAMAHALVPSKASACSCLGSDIVAPRNNETVPTNARVWVKLASWQLDNSPDATLIIEPDTATVGDFSDIQLTGGWILRSYAIDGLAPGSNYTASWQAEWGIEMSVQFTVGNSALDAAPAVPTITRCEEDKEEESLFGGISSCGEWHKMDIDISAPGAAVVVALRSGDGELDGVTRTGKVTSAANFMFEGDSMFRTYLGTAPCGPTTWDIDQGSTSVKVGSFDIAGNWSGWSGNGKVVAGCEGGGTPSTPLGLALALLLVAVTRRHG